MADAVIFLVPIGAFLAAGALGAVLIHRGRTRLYVVLLVLLVFLGLYVIEHLTSAPGLDGIGSAFLLLFVLFPSLLGLAIGGGIARMRGRHR